MSEEMKCPQGGLIRALVNSRRTNSLNGYSEFIDNSLSAKSTSISIKIFPEKIEITDNGIGTDHPRAIITPADSRPMDSTSQYGVGAALSMLILSDWGQCLVKSFHNGNLYSQFFDWTPYKCNPTLPLEFSEPLIVEPREGVGTTILYERRKIFPAWHPQWEDELGFRYSTAIKSGCVIQVTPSPNASPIVIKPYAHPLFKRGSSLNKSVKHSKYGVVKILAGIVKDDVPNPRRGFHVYWGKRMLVSGSSEAAQIRDSNVNRLYAEIVLDSNTFSGVNTYKDNFSLSEIEMEEFWQFIANECASVIDSAKEAGECHKLQSFNAKAQGYFDDLLNAGQAVGKEKRDSKKNEGSETISPAHTGIQRRNATKVLGDGSVLQRSTRNGALQIRLRPDTTSSVPFDVMGGRNNIYDVTYNPALQVWPEKILEPQSIAMAAYLYVAMKMTEISPGMLQLDGSSIDRVNSIIAEHRNLSDRIK